MAEQDLKAELERLKAENEALKQKKTRTAHARTTLTTFRPDFDKCGSQHFMLRRNDIAARECLQPPFSVGIGAQTGVALPA